MSHMNRNAYLKLSSEWYRICSDLPPATVAKSLNRIAINFPKLSLQHRPPPGNTLHQFLEKHVIRVIDPSLQLHGGGFLSLREVMEPLQKRAMVHGKSNNFTPKDISLVLNAYAKIYHSILNSKGLPLERWGHPQKFLRRYASEMIPEATRLVAHMNEQDLSLVLNCASRMAILDQMLLLEANNVLVSNLREYYTLPTVALEGNDTPRSEASNEDKKALGNSNLLSQFTPQGVALVVNCFAKSHVKLDDDVLSFIVHKYIQKNLEKFLTQQLVVLTHSLLKLKVPLKDVTDTLRHLDRIVARDCRDVDTKIISMLLYTLGKYNYRPTATAKELDRVSKAHVPIRCSELELCNMYYGLGKLNLRCTRFVERLNRAVRDLINGLTPQAISTIYYALARLDIKIPGDASQEGQEAAAMHELLLRRFEEIVKLNEMKLRHGKHDQKDPLEVLPLHVVNVCFSASTYLETDDRLFSYLLRHLLWTCLDLQAGLAINRANSKAGAMDQVSPAFDVGSMTDASITDLISKQLGTQGIYQLYCISQHIMFYTKSGLETQRLEVLQLLKRVFDIWDQISRGKPSEFSSEPIKEHAEEGSTETVFVDPDITTSKIQEDVFSVLKDLSSLARAKWPHHASQEGADYQPMLVSEAPATPYVIDILLCSV